MVNIESMTDSYSGTSLRVGATNDMLNHPTTEFFHALARGGWECSGMTKMFEYVMLNDVAVSVGGKALSGWRNSRKKVKSPSLKPIIGDIRSGINIDNLLNTLFSALSTVQIKHEGLLMQLKRVMFASILLHWLTMTTKYYNSTIVQKIIRICSQFDIDSDVLLQWSEIIQSDWVLMNGGNLGKSDESEETLKDMEITLKLQQKETGMA